MKRLLLMFAAVLGLIAAGGALAGTPLGSSRPRGAGHSRGARPDRALLGPAGLAGSPVTIARAARHRWRRPSPRHHPPPGAGGPRCA
jgi:hypothetical protein